MFDTLEYKGTTIETHTNVKWQKCKEKCHSNDACMAWTYYRDTYSVAVDRNKCILKDSSYSVGVITATIKTGVVSGTKNCGKAMQ